MIENPLSRKIWIKKYPKEIGHITSENKYWKSFKNPITIKESSTIKSIDFSPISPHDFAVTHSAKIHVFSGNSLEEKKSISQFKDLAYSGRYRSDGKLLVAGEETGVVQVFTADKRGKLRILMGHKGSTRFTTFSPNNVHILSCSDDNTVRLWDLSTSETLCKFTDHQDYVRTGAIVDDNPNLLISGSYDHTIKLWDVRERKCIRSFTHGQPVESILHLPGSGVIVSAGGNELKVWDLLSGGGLLQTVSNHQKTITCLTYDKNMSRVISGSLDHYLKIYNTEDFKVTHSIKYPSALTSIGLSPDNKVLVAGMVDGLISIRSRELEAEEEPEEEVPTNHKRGTKAYFSRGIEGKPDDSCIMVPQRKRESLNHYEKLLKKHNHVKGLDAVLDLSKPFDPDVVISLLEYLMKTGSLQLALGGRDDASLYPIIVFICNYINDPNFSSFLIDVTMVVLDLYENLIPESPEICEAMTQLRKIVSAEIKLQEEMMQSMGAIDFFINSSKRY